MATLHRPASLVRAGLPVYQAGIRAVSYTHLDVYKRQGHGRLAQGFLLVVSLAFYGKGNLAFLPLLLGSILFNFLVGKAMGALPRARKPLLVLGLLGNLGLLGYFKYANFFLDNLNWLLGTSIGALSLLLPLGISFFTFQQIAFLVDRYRGDPADYTLLELSLLHI